MANACKICFSREWNFILAVRRAGRVERFKHVVSFADDIDDLLFAKHFSKKLSNLKKIFTDKLQTEFVRSVIISTVNRKIF